MAKSSHFGSHQHSSIRPRGIIWLAGMTGELTEKHPTAGSYDHSNRLPTASAISRYSKAQRPVGKQGLRSLQD